MAINNFNKNVLAFGIFPGWTLIPLLASIPFLNFTVTLIALCCFPIGAFMHLKRLTPGKVWRSLSDSIMGGRRYNRSPWRQ